jgi:arylsulfatase A-like enzyme
MKIHLTISLFLWFVIPPCRAAEPPSNRPPDILVIYTDDHRADALGCAGNKHLRTPNIDRLAERGTFFRNAYLSGADCGALCMPSRAMLMTGRNFPRIAREGGWNLAPQPTLPSILREHGYRTHMCGKWHNGGPALSRAFPDAGPVLLGGMGDHLRKKVVEVKGGTISDPMRIPKHSTEAFTDGALDFISTLTPNDPPFFLYLAYSAPHDPRQPVSPWRERQEASPPPLPPNFMPRHPFNNGALLIRDEHLAPWPRPENMIREQTAHYHAMIEQLDNGIGRVMDALAKVGRLDRTLIVFAGDNGLSMGSHGLVGKQSPYEHALRVPLIITGPGLASGRKHHGLATITDLMPTVLDLAGFPIPADLDGLSLKPALTEANHAVRDRLSMSVYLDDLNAHVLRDGPWKLIRYPYLDRTQLFNLTDDPYEMRDLSSAAGQSPRIAAMMENLATEMRAAGVKKPLITGRRIPAELDWSNVTQQMDEHQPDWIRKRFSLPPVQ